MAAPSAADSLPVAVARVAAHEHSRACLDDPACPAYDAVAALLARLDDPLSRLARPGGRTVIKPNFVAERDRERLLSDEELAATCTDPVVLAAVIDQAWRAMEERGEILVVDSPIEGTDIDSTMRRIGVTTLLERLRGAGVNVSFRDLRDFTMVRHFLLDDVKAWGRSWNLGLLEKRDIPGDPDGYLQVDLGQASYFERDFVGMERLRFHQSDTARMTPWHAPGRHIYSVARSVMTADLVINVPKLKTHKKCGVTLALKSLIGISNRKHWIPHFRCGWPPAGDEFDRPLSWRELLAVRLKRFSIGGGHSIVCNVVPLAKRDPVVEGGSWRGNDVVWRATRDLNTILLYATADGALQSTRARGYLSIIDGIVGGEGEGPLRPTPVQSNVLIGGEEPLSVDVVACALMGVPQQRIALVSAPCIEPYRLGETEPAQIDVRPQGEPVPGAPYRLPRGWRDD